MTAIVLAATLAVLPPLPIGAAGPAKAPRVENPMLVAVVVWAAATAIAITYVEARRR